MRSGIVVATVALIGGITPPALAQSDRHRGYDRPAVIGSEYYSCSKASPNDMTSRNPRVYKQADGRCSNPLPGGGGGFIR